ncbi:MAG: glutamate carboxypeptidase [Candidatus Competibacteraceae bacterium]
MLKRASLIVALGLLCSVGRIAGGVENQVSPAAILELAEAEQPAFMKTLESLVNIDTGTGHTEGLAQAEKILVDRLQALGMDVTLKPAEAFGGNNIIGTLQGKGGGKVLLMIHYDTVFGPGEVEKRPFRTAEGRAYGPGVADAKGGIAIILHAIALLKKLNFDRIGVLTVLFNPDEEKGSFGSRELIRELASQHDYALSYEPPETEMVTVATNGINYVFLAVKGVASHAGSAPEKGRNAITELAHQLLRLQDLGNLEKKTTVNWTIVTGGERRNIIPAEANAEGDMRYADYSEIERVTAEASRIVQEHLIPDTEVEFRLERGRPPLPDNPATKKLAALAQTLYQDIGRELGIVAMRFGTDAGYAYAPDTTKPAVLETLGLVGARIHSPDEYVELDSIAPRLYLTARLIMELSKTE